MIPGVLGAWGLLHTTVQYAKHLKCRPYSGSGAGRRQGGTPFSRFPVFLSTTIVRVINQFFDKRRFF